MSLRIFSLSLSLSRLLSSSSRTLPRSLSTSLASSSLAFLSLSLTSSRYALDCSNLCLSAYTSISCFCAATSLSPLAARAAASALLRSPCNSSLRLASSRDAKSDILSSMKVEITSLETFCSLHETLILFLSLSYSSYDSNLPLETLSAIGAYACSRNSTARFSSLFALSVIMRPPSSESLPSRSARCLSISPSTASASNVPLARTSISRSRVRASISGMGGSSAASATSLSNTANACATARRSLPSQT
mmetsp:Transcript_31237/g.72781  ORF Transcript_31237/g.72781 Transcript_31237/m.72781 type:complete len:249 (-) Transcript_31237:689-1435(-)